MWYFSWILGYSLACCFAILNAMWLEIYYDDKSKEDAAKFADGEKHILLDNNRK